MSTTADAAAFLGLGCRVVRPGDDQYDTARSSWNRLFSHRPTAIVYVQSTSQVVAAVTSARRVGVPLRVRSGGHCLEGWSTVDDGLVIDVSDLTSVSIDAVRMTATVGAGLTQAAVVAALAAEGLAVPTGTEGSVGLVGATLGGGLGLLTRAYGMACDNLLAAEIVVASADGAAEAIYVDADHHADLLWALRGAGNGSFGVVTSLTYAVHPLSRVSTLTATWSGLDLVSELLTAWQGTAPFADERLTSQLELSRNSMTLFAVLAPGGDPAEIERLLHPLLSIGHPDVLTIDASWADAYDGLQIPLDDEPANWKFSSQFVAAPFPVEAIEIVRSLLAEAPTDGCNYFTNAFGGAVARSEPAGGSAFAHRDALFYAEPGAGWGVRGGVPAADDPLTPDCLRWVDDFTAALTPFGNGAYSNVPNAEAVDWQRDYWGAGAERLREVKALYDPSDVFCFPQSVPLDSGA
ncbi:MAG: FAD-binding oxidoreductase [Microbacterium enclense]